MTGDTNGNGSAIPSRFRRGSFVVGMVALAGTLLIAASRHSTETWFLAGAALLVGGGIGFAIRRRRRTRGVRPTSEAARRLILTLGWIFAAAVYWAPELVKVGIVGVAAGVLL